MYDHECKLTLPEFWVIAEVTINYQLMKEDEIQSHAASTYHRYIRTCSVQQNLKESGSNETGWIV